MPSLGLMAYSVTTLLPLCYHHTNNTRKVKTLILEHSYWSIHHETFTQCKIHDHNKIPTFFCLVLPTPEKFHLMRDPVSKSGVARLQSRFLKSSEDACLQFWYYKPHQDSSKLRVLLKDNVIQTEVWSSQAAESHVWRQVLIPLTHSQLNGVQVYLADTYRLTTQQAFLVEFIK